MGLTTLVLEAMEKYRQDRAAGVPAADALMDLEASVRRNWPTQRPWKYLCEKCDDTGAIWAGCPGSTRCGRTKPHGPHQYVTFCLCKAGDGFRKPLKREDDDIGQAGSRRKMTRMGR